MAQRATSKRVTTKASGTLKSKSTGKASKTASRSKLSQNSPQKRTTKEDAKVASRTLRNNKKSAQSKSMAGHVLSKRRNVKPNTVKKK